MRYFNFTVVFVVIMTIFTAPSFAQGNDDADINKSLQEQMQELQAQIQQLSQTPSGSQSSAGGQAGVSSQKMPMTSLEKSLSVLTHTIVDAEKPLVDFQSLCQISGRQCYFVSEFWRVRAFQSCIRLNEYVLQDMAAIEDIKDEERNYFNAMMEQCNISYYYDNVNEIAKTIRKALEIAKK